MKKIRYYFRYFFLPSLAFASLATALFLHFAPQHSVTKNLKNRIGLEQEIQKNRDDIFTLKQKVLEQGKQSPAKISKPKSTPQNTLTSLNELAKSLHHEGNPFEILERKEGPKGFELQLRSSNENMEKLLDWTLLSQESWSQEPSLFLEKWTGTAPEQKGTASLWTLTFTYPAL